MTPELLPASNPNVVAVLVESGAQEYRHEPIGEGETTEEFTARIAGIIGNIDTPPYTAFLRVESGGQPNDKMSGLVVLAMQRWRAENPKTK